MKKYYSVMGHNEDDNSKLHFGTLDKELAFQMAKEHSFKEDVTIEVYESLYGQALAEG